MARDNYSYQKYRRELAKKKKKEEKMQRKLDKKKQAGEAAPQVPGEAMPGEAIAPAPEQPSNGQDSPIE